MRAHDSIAPHAGCTVQLGENMPIRSVHLDMAVLTPVPW